MVDKGSELRTDFIDPTVQGTLSVLKLAREQRIVKKVVIISPFVAHMPMEAMMKNGFAIESVGLHPLVLVFCPRN
jgi:nucleoside-diphosphate-sugar epimerase